jgi:copper chaperone CopZ
MTSVQEVTEIKIEGMSCDGCSRSVRKALEKVQGLFVDDVRIGSATLRLAGASRGDVISAIHAAGYRVRMAEEG